MSEIKNSGAAGQIQIADDVIAMIAGTATLEIDGVAGMTGNITDIVEIIGKKNLGKGVKVEVAENTISLDIHIMVKFGYKIHDVSTQVQERVKNAVESMTGLSVSEVNIFVSGVQLEKDKSKEQHAKYPESE